MHAVCARVCMHVSVCVHVCTCTWAAPCIWSSEDSLQKQFSLSSMWVPGMRLLSSGLVARAFTR